jgi:hypothetical protein
MTTISWMYDTSAPLKTAPLSTQTTYFATSSLASRARNTLTTPKPGPSGVYEGLLATRGVPNTGITIYDTDKSPYGTEVARISMASPISRQNPFVTARQITGPNVASLRRKDFLSGGIN